MPTTRIRVSMLFLFLLVALLPATVWAQVYSSSLTGVIKDPSGAVVPGTRGQVDRC